VLIIGAVLVTIALVLLAVMIAHEKS